MCGKSCRRGGSTRSAEIDGLWACRIAVRNSQGAGYACHRARREGNADGATRSRGQACAAIVGLSKIVAGCDARDGERGTPDVAKCHGLCRTGGVKMLVTEVQAVGR